MTGAEAIKTAMKERGVTQVQIAKLMGMKGQTNVCEALKRDMRVSLVARFAEVLGYELVLQKKKPGRKEEGQLRIDNIPARGVK